MWCGCRCCRPGVCLFVPFRIRSGALGRIKQCATRGSFPRPGLRSACTHLRTFVEPGPRICVDRTYRRASCGCVRKFLRWSAAYECIEHDWSVVGSLDRLNYNTPRYVLYFMFAPDPASESCIHTLRKTRRDMGILIPVTTGTTSRRTCPLRYTAHTARHIDINGPCACSCNQCSAQHSRPMVFPCITVIVDHMHSPVIMRGPFPFLRASIRMDSCTIFGNSLQQCTVEDRSIRTWQSPVNYL